MNTTQMTHASHFQRLKNDKGYFWASNYWSKYAGQIITNELSTGDPYGSKGGQNWQIIALAEGWANYRKWKMAVKYLNWFESLNLERDKGTSIIRYFSDRSFPVNYGEMFDKLVEIGCSAQNIEKSLLVYSVVEFRNNLIAKHNSLRDQIISITAYYE